MKAGRGTVRRLATAARVQHLCRMYARVVSVAFSVLKCLTLRRYCYCCQLCDLAEVLTLPPPAHPCPHVQRQGGADRHGRDARHQARAAQANRGRRVRPGGEAGRRSHRVQGGGAEWGGATPVQLPFACGRASTVADVRNLHGESSCRCCGKGAGTPPLYLPVPSPHPFDPSSYLIHTLQVLVLEQPLAVPAERAPWTPGRDVWWGDVVPMMVSSGGLRRLCFGARMGLSSMGLWALQRVAFATCS